MNQQGEIPRYIIKRKDKIQNNGYSMLGIKQARRTCVCIFADICVKHFGKDIQKTYVIEGGPGS